MKVIPVGEGQIRIETDEGMGFNVKNLVGGGLDICGTLSENLSVKVSALRVFIRMEEVKDES